nr:MAG: prepilin-type cleavage/methylation domain-containing protein [Bacillota bacterium]
MRRLDLSPIVGIFKAGKNEKGMTLIEVILTTALLSLLLVASYALISSGLKMYRQTLDESSDLQNARYAIYRLSVAIGQAKDVRVVSKSKVEIKMPDNSKVYYYLQYGTLYREKNGGKNPVAELSFIEFYQNPETKTVKIVLKAGRERGITLQTSVTPIGAVIGIKP